MMPNAIHISSSKTWYRIVVPGLEWLLYLKGGTLVRASAKVTQDAAGKVKKKNEKKKTSVFLCAIAEH